jgi:hypothetical protein
MVLRGFPAKRNCHEIIAAAGFTEGKVMEESYIKE